MRVTLENEASLAIERECRAAPGTETGGVLIGDLQGDHAIVQTVTGPGPNAVCLSKRLDWDASYIEGVIHGVDASVVLQVLGRWHKHASPIILPSEADRAGAEWFRKCVAPTGSTVELIIACDEEDVPMALGVYFCAQDGLERIR